MSVYFQPAEFRCKDPGGGPYPAEWVDNRLAALCSQLDVIREAWGGPLEVVSGYRTPAHNAAVGGARASQHMEGRAADIRPVLVGGADLHERVMTLHDLVLRLIKAGRLPLVGGLGLYPGRWIHVDIRPHTDHLAQWVGTGVGSEVA